MSKSFWALIELHTDKPITEELVKKVCYEIYEQVPDLAKITPADPDTYVGE